jgi:hypothetical protein
MNQQGLVQRSRDTSQRSLVEDQVGAGERCFDRLAIPDVLDDERGAFRNPQFGTVG